MLRQNEQAKQLMMLRIPAPVPDIPMPGGWFIRSMLPGEGPEWSRIVQSAGFYAGSPLSPGELWMEIMGSDASVKTENVFFACDAGGRPVATAAAKFIPEEQEGNFPVVQGTLGMLHYVAAMPEIRGAGAGSAVTAAVLRRFGELGIFNCVLTTDDYRLPAIKSYLRLGWEPVLYAPDMRGRWEKVFASLGYSVDLKRKDESDDRI